MKQNGDKKRKTLVSLYARNSGDVNTLGKKFAHEHKIIKGKKPDLNSFPSENQEIFNITKNLGLDHATLNKQPRSDNITSRPLMKRTPKLAKQKPRNGGIMGALEKIILENDLI